MHSSASVFHLLQLVQKLLDHPGLHIEDNKEQRHNKLKINMQRDRKLGVPSLEVRGWAVIAA